MSRFLSLGLAIVLVLVGAGFAALNASQRVTVRLGFTTLYYVPLAWVVFGSLVLGMVIMLIAGVRSDLKVRRILRDRFVQGEMEERSRVDRNQGDLFGSGGSEP